MSDGADKAAYLSDGLELIKQGSFKAALKHFEKGECWVEAAKVAQRLKKHNKAIDYFLKGGDTAAAAKVHLEKGNLEQAAALFETAKHYRDAALAIEGRLKNDFGIKRPNDVLADVPTKIRPIIKRLIENLIHSKDYDMLGSWCLGLGELSKAAQSFATAKNYQRAAKLYERAEKFDAAANMWKQAGNLAKAAEMYEQLENFEAAGDVYRESGDVENAVRCYRRARTPAAAGQIYFAKGDYVRAADLFEEGSAFLDAAKAYVKLNDYSQTCKMACQVSKIDPDYAKAAMIATRCCVELGEISFEADTFIKDIFDKPLNDKSAALFEKLATLYEKNQFFESAKDLLVKVHQYRGNKSCLGDRIKQLEARIVGTPMAVQQVLEKDYGYQETAERLNQYKPSEAPERKTSGPQGIDLIRPGSKFATKYEIKKLISGTSIASVYAAEESELGDPVCVEAIRPGIADTLWDDFTAVIKAFRRIKHPQLLNVLDTGRFGPFKYVVTESMVEDDDVNLDEISYERRYQGFLKLVNLVSKLHEEDIIHGDLCRHSLVFQSKQLERIRPPRAGVRLLEDRGNLESEIFVPEWLDGKQASKRGDVFSLGLLGTWFLTSSWPEIPNDIEGAKAFFKNQSVATLIERDNNIPSPVKDVLRKSMQYDRDARYATAMHIAQELEGLSGTPPTTNSEHTTPVPPTEPTTPPGESEIINGRYQIESELGRGGMGIVYKAFDTQLQRPVALKFLPHEIGASEQQLNQFLNEARSAARLSHQNIVTVYNVEDKQGEYFIVMEFIDGIDIRTLLETMETLPYKSIDLICRQVCDGLAYAHKNKVFHRDIKSANILWTNDKVVKITDFGLAKVVTDALAKSTRVQGSPAYMSPEQILGENVDHRTDIYSLGIMMYEMTTGFVPFMKGDISHHQLHTEPRPVTDFKDDVPDYIEAIMMKCLKKKPEERFQSIQEIVDALNSVQAS